MTESALLTMLRPEPSGDLSTSWAGGRPIAPWPEVGRRRILTRSRSASKRSPGVGPRLRLGVAHASAMLRPPQAATLCRRNGSSASLVVTRPLPALRWSPTPASVSAVVAGRSSPHWSSDPPCSKGSSSHSAVAWPST